MDYYSNGKKISLIHFENRFDESQLLFEEELTRKIELDPEIAILSNCDNMSFLSKQCTFNKIKIKSVNAQDILNILNTTPSKYVLLILGDAMLLDGLTGLKTEDFIMCGNNEPNSKYFPVNNNCELMFSGVNKYANPNLIFGRRTKVLEFFEDFFEFCYKTFGMPNPYASKNTNAIFNLWYSSAYKKYNIDSNITYMTSLTRNNYNVREELNEYNHLSRNVTPKNFYETEFRLF